MFIWTCYLCGFLLLSNMELPLQEVPGA